MPIEDKIQSSYKTTQLSNLGTDDKINNNKLLSDHETALFTFEHLTAIARHGQLWQADRKSVV